MRRMTRQYLRKLRFANKTGGCLALSSKSFLFNIRRGWFTSMRHYSVLSNEQRKCSNAVRNIFQATLALQDRIVSLRHRRHSGKFINWDLDNAFDRVRLLIDGYFKPSFEIDRSVSVFWRFGLIAGLKLNLRKTVAVNVGTQWID